MNTLHRRDFIRTSLFGGIAAAALPASAMEALSAQTKVAYQGGTSKVSLVTGSSRADMAFKALQPLSKEIAQAIGNKRVLIKPNLVSSSIQLSASHVESMEGILEFLKSINKLENTIIAESAADGPTMLAFENYKYLPLVDKYKVKLVDLDEQPTKTLYAIDERDFRPHPIRMSALLQDPNNFILSAARMKTHDRVLCTLSLKNVIVAAPIKDPGFSFGRNRKPGAQSDKAFVHGNGFKGINYNLFSLAYDIHPNLAFIDGFDGMEGNGPTNGTPVDHRVCLAGLDWLATDRVGAELMGIDYANIGYLNFCADAGMGQGDLSKIEVIGEKIADHIKVYKLANNIDQQLSWKEPFQPAVQSKRVQ